MRVLWHGPYKDAALALFVDDSDKRCKVIHFRMESLDIVVTGECHFETEEQLRFSIQDRIKMTMEVVEEKYFEACMNFKETMVKHHGAGIH